MSKLGTGPRQNGFFLRLELGLYNNRLNVPYVWECVSSITQPLLAPLGVSTFNITVLDCLQGLYKAKCLGWVNLDTFDVAEYARDNGIGGLVGELTKYSPNPCAESWCRPVSFQFPISP